MKINFTPRNLQYMSVAQKMCRNWISTALNQLDLKKLLSNNDMLM